MPDEYDDSAMRREWRLTIRTVVLCAGALACLWGAVRLTVMALIGPPPWSQLWAVPAGLLFSACLFAAWAIVATAVDDLRELFRRRR